MAECASGVGNGLKNFVTLQWGKDNVFYLYQALFAGMLAFGGGYWVLQAAIVQANAASETTKAADKRERERTAIENDRLRTRRLSELDGLAKQTMLAVQALNHQLDQSDADAVSRINEATDRLLRQCERLVTENPNLAIWTQSTALEAVRIRLRSMNGQGGTKLATDGRILRDALAAFYERPERLADSATLTLRVVKAPPPRNMGEDRVHAESIIPSFASFFD